MTMLVCLNQELILLLFLLVAGVGSLRGFVFHVNSLFHFAVVFVGAVVGS